MTLSRRRGVLVVAVTVLFLSTLIVFYFAWSISPTSGSVVKRTVDSLSIPAGTGEGTVAIDPTNSSRMVYHALGLSDNVPFYSQDGGVTWNESKPFPIGTPTAVLDPWITYDSQGRIYASTYEGNMTHPYDWDYPFLAHSTDHGVSFSLQSTSYSPPWTMWTMPNGTLAPSCHIPGPGAIDFPKIAADKSPTSPYRDYVYIVGAVGVNSSGTPFCYGQTAILRSTDRGATWDVHKVLAGLNNEIVVRPDNMVIGPNGTVYFATGSFGGSGGVLIVYSRDGGATWSTHAVSLGFIASEPWMAVDQNSSKNLYVAFEKTINNSIHIYMISSTNGGATWSTPIRLDDVLSDDTVDHTLPSMDVSLEGRVFVAWRDYRNTISKTWANSNTTDIYAYSSTSAGANLRISGSTGRYCGPYSACYRISGNDFFGVASGRFADHVAFSLDEKGNGWPEAYDGIVGYAATRGLSPVAAAIYRIVTSFYLELVGLVGGSVATVIIITIFKRRVSGRKSESPFLHRRSECASLYKRG